MKRSAGSHSRHLTPELFMKQDTWNNLLFLFLHFNILNLTPRYYHCKGKGLLPMDDKVKIEIGTIAK